MERIYDGKDDIYTHEYDEREEIGERQRTIWVNENFYHWGEYVTGKIRNCETEQQYRKRKQDRKLYADELGQAKNEMGGRNPNQMGEWIYTNYHPRNKRRGKWNARIAWQKINEMKNKTTSKRKGNMALTDESGNKQNETKLLLEIMQKYIKRHFARTREKW